MRYIPHFLAFTLMLSLALPLPMAGHAASRNTDDSAIIHARLNSAERKAAIARAAEMDKAAREAFVRGEKYARGEGGGIISPPSPLALSPSTPQLGDTGKSAAVAQSTKNVNRPKSIAEVMFNAAAGMAGLPGLANDRYDPYDPNADQGLGFHADGTARRADGTTGTNAAGAGYNGRRAAAYAGSGLGYGPYGTYGSMGGNGLYANEPGYDPVTGQNFRYGDPTNGGRRINGQGGYGSLDNLDPTRMMLDRGLNYGLGLANSAAEGLFLGVMDSPYGGARARFNFMVDWNGKVNGEGDLLLPWYDSKYTTVYSQFGARTMNAEDSRDRWIGNFGLGQRWYPYAVNDGTGEDAGNLMLGYNAFFDNDFTRSHQRGGVGIEAQYDWLHLASNYYVPLSSWKNSKDFDGDFVKERAAEGWDIRAKGYLPFYRNVALTGAYTQWYGDNVGMFGASRLERDPKVWSYGLEYTPIPLVSGFVNQRSTEHGRSDTELGLRFTYHFQMPWEDQIRHDKVAQLRTVGGSRHEFVDRENRIILEYKARNNHHVEFAGRSGDVFTFRIRNGFDNYVAGQTVRVSADGVTTLAEAKTEPATFLARAGEFLGSMFSVSAAYAAPLYQTYVTDRNGQFSIIMTGHNAGSTVTVQTGTTSHTFTAAELGGGGGGASNSYNLSGLAVDASGNLGGTITVTQNGSPASGVAVTLSYATFGGSGTATPASLNLGTTDSSGQVTVSGSVTALPRQVRFTANNDTASAVTKTVGTVPTGFITGRSLSLMNWAAAGTYCSQHGGRLPKVNNTASYPYSGNTGTEPVDGFGSFGGSWPAGVPIDYYWSGTELSDAPGQSWSITNSSGLVTPQWDTHSTGRSVICVP